MSTASDDNDGVEWKDGDIYPPVEDIAKALQDPGKPKKVVTKNGEVTRHQCPALEKLAYQVYEKILKVHNNPKGLTVSVSRGKKPLLIEMVLKRKHVDVTECDPFFQNYQQQGMVYLWRNDKKLCGLDQCVAAFQENRKVDVAKKESARTGNDGFRLCCVLLDPQFRGSVSGIMSKKRTGPDRIRAGTQRCISLMKSSARAS